jgi:hypothetical protein
MAKFKGSKLSSRMARDVFAKWSRIEQQILSCSYIVTMSKEAVSGRSQ